MATVFYTKLCNMTHGVKKYNPKYILIGKVSDVLRVSSKYNFIGCVIIYLGQQTSHQTSLQYVDLDLSVYT